MEKKIKKILSEYLVETPLKKDGKVVGCQVFYGTAAEELTKFFENIHRQELQELRVAIPDEDFGIGYIWINRKKYLVENHSKEFRMITELAKEQNKKIDKLLAGLDDTIPKKVNQ